jgi:hypothetical protein
MRMDQDFNGLLCFARCEHTGYPPVIVRLKSVGALEENCRQGPEFYEVDGQGVAHSVPSCLSGKHFPEATLVIRKAGEKPVDDS